MEMRKTVLYGVLAFCLVVLNSCLGDPATQLTMANQAGVVVTGYGPGKAIYTKGDVVVSSEDFQNANVENGECILFDYSIRGRKQYGGRDGYQLYRGYYL